MTSLPVSTSLQIDPESWVDSYADSLFSYAFFRVQDKILAEELVQETFVAALTAREKFQGYSSEKTWFFSILKHKIVDSFRQKYRQKLQSLEVTPEHQLGDFFTPEGEWLEKPGKWRESPQQSFEQKEFFAVFQGCLTSLTQKQADAFTLREFEDADCEKICRFSFRDYLIIKSRK